mmetsp:Transcript_93654/g.270576  ORF Transcript_93654/g.270576 Transcript_93654/m.270576 type:complete len:211 (-) Transcript_93654:4846-5478(-)
MPLSSHKRSSLPWIMKSNIQLFVGSKPFVPCVGCPATGKQFKSKCKTFLAEVTMSEIESKSSPFPVIAENGDRARYLVIFLMIHAAIGVFSSAKGAPLGSQPAGNSSWLTGNRMSKDMSFLVEATVQANSWTCSTTLLLYAITSSAMGPGSNGSSGQDSQGWCFFRLGRSCGSVEGNRRLHRNQLSTAASFTVKCDRRSPFCTLCSSLRR